MVGVALELQVPESAVYIVGSSLWCKDNVISIERSMV